jgi:hypothetical protein
MRLLISQLKSWRSVDDDSGLSDVHRGVLKAIDFAATLTFGIIMR